MGALRGRAKAAGDWGGAKKSRRPYETPAKTDPLGYKIKTARFAGGFDLRIARNA